MMNSDPMVIYELPKNAYYNIYDQSSRISFKHAKTDSN